MVDSAVSAMQGQRVIRTLNYQEWNINTIPTNYIYLNTIIISIYYIHILSSTSSWSLAKKQLRKRKHSFLFIDIYLLGQIFSRWLVFLAYFIFIIFLSFIIHHNNNRAACETTRDNLDIVYLALRSSFIDKHHIIPIPVYFLNFFDLIIKHLNIQLYIY